MPEHTKTSIVIPHYNNNNRLEKTLYAVKREIGNQKNVQVIVVDNKSERCPKSLVEGFGACFLEETTHLYSPYSARNRGIEKSDGEIIILLDSTCVPQRNWLHKGLQFLSKNEADIVSSNILYEHSPGKPTLSQVWNSCFGVDAKKSIDKRGYAPGGCLFIKRSVFDTLGLFAEGIRSGGDYTFTNTAVRLGYKLMFCEDSVVKYPAKSYAELKAKSIRVGKGQVGVWLSSGKFWFYFVKFLFKPFYPPNLKRISLAYKSKHKLYSYNKVLFFQLFFLGWHLRLLQFYGNLLGLACIIKSKPRFQKKKQ